MTTNGKKRVTLFLNSDLLKYAKAQAAVEEMSLTALIEQDLVKYLPKETLPKSAKVNKGEVGIKRN